MSAADPAHEPLRSPQGELRLRRHPERANETLRAWDAADELLLGALDSTAPATAPDWPAAAPDGTVVVLNDSFGAISIAAASAGATSVTAVSDSYSARRGLVANQQRNRLAADAVATRSPLEDLAGPIDLLLVRPTKSLALLEAELRRVAPLLGPGSVVLGASMTKHLHSSTLEVFERVVGPTHTSRAARKARLIRSEPSPSTDPGPWAWPRSYTIDPGHHVITSHPGVFSSERLDRGTALLLEHLPEQEGVERVIDLGCGNGVVGVVAAAENADAELLFVDDSAMAVESARASWAAEFPGREAEFVNGNGLEDWPDGPGVAASSVDLVLNNPPFHDNFALGDATAWQMFSESHRALRSGGELWVVGNRHLAYHAKMKRIFGNCDVVGSDSKFVVLRAVRR